jgi:ubiquinone/menaquinone biosynthesis C-methylase UbiE
MKHFVPSDDIAASEAVPALPRPFFSPRLFMRKPNQFAPDYLDDYYWWAYVEPRAVKFFERDWLINLILCGNYKPLGEAAIKAFGDDFSGRTLQISCCYGNLTPNLAAKIAEKGGTLDVIDVMPIQLENLASKLTPDTPAELLRMDARTLDFPDAQFDRVLLFFLLHEQPPGSREKVLLEALRVLKPGGQLVIVDYGQPARWHPLRYLLLPLLGLLEPFAVALWRRELTDILASSLKGCTWRKTPYYGGLYQCIAVSKE